MTHDQYKVSTKRSIGSIAPLQGLVSSAHTSDHHIIQRHELQHFAHYYAHPDCRKLPIFSKTTLSLSEYQSFIGGTNLEASLIRQWDLSGRVSITQCATCRGLDTG